MLVAICVFVGACAKTLPEKKGYPAHVGDTSFNKDIDDPDFKICHPQRSFQYYHSGKGLQYKGEKQKITEHFLKNFQSPVLPGQSGYITIRFIVNCEGKTGWYRIQQMDFDYQEKEFNETLVAQLLELTKQLDGWIPVNNEKQKVDYYQYLTFKLENGKIKEILT